MEPIRRRAYYEANRENEITKATERKARYIERNCTFVAEYLSDHPCVDCGESDIVVLEFDHLRDKDGLVSALVYRPAGLDKIRAEIEKCEVVCANCHKRRTSTRGGHWRTRYAPLV